MVNGTPGIGASQQKKLQMVRDGDETEFAVKEVGSLYFHNRLCVPDDKELKKKLLFKAHNTVFTMHLGGNKSTRT